VTTPDSATDLRVYFAAERTLLAWVRTAVTLMAFGFVIARFGLFLRLMHLQAGESATSGLSPFLGAAMVWLGVAALSGGALQFQAFCRRLSLGERPPASSLWFALAVAWALALTGLVLGVALLR
jgi:putative membrane protein